MPSPLLVNDIRELVVRRFGAAHAGAATFNEKRIDVQGNLGNRGIFRHDIIFSNGENWTVVEKRATSEREWHFYHNLYQLGRQQTPPMTPELYGTSQRNGKDFALFLAWGACPHPEFSETVAKQVACLISRVARLPSDGLTRTNTNPWSAERAKEYIEISRAEPHLPEPDFALIRSLESHREKFLTVLGSLPSYPHHGDVKWNNMVTSNVEGGREIHLIDWGQLAVQTEGFDFHEFFNYDDDGELMRPDFLELLVARYRDYSNSRTASESLLLSGAVTRMNWALGRFKRLRRTVDAELFLASTRHAVRIVERHL